MARIVIRNALFFGSERFSNLLLPWCTYTMPEVAHVGLYERDLKERGIKYAVFKKHFANNDRAKLDDETEGFVKLLIKEGSDKICGATIVAPDAGNMISELTLAINNKLTMGQIAATIHPYPTQAEVIRQLGDEYNRIRLTPTVKMLFRTLLEARR